MERTHCREGHPLDEANAYRLRRGNGRIELRCRACQNRKAAASRLRHQEEINRRAREKAAQVDRAAQMPLCGCGGGKRIMPSTLRVDGGSGVCSTCHYKRIKRWRETHPERYKELVRRHRVKLVSEFIEAYGGGCNCCGEDEPLFLTLDHVNNDGGGRDRGKVTDGILRKLRAAGWPEDPRYTLACWNCNSGRHRNGGICPHQTAKEGTP